VSSAFSCIGLTIFHVPADSNDETDSFNGQGAEDKGGARQGCGEEH
jgi:hypothetical protein